MYNFYYEKNGEAIGPYSAEEMAMMQLPEDTLVTEDSLNGEWRNANEFDFDELASMEFSDYDKPFEKMIISSMDMCRKIQKYNKLRMRITKKKV